jgi:hypothetical protein
VITGDSITTTVISSWNDFIDFGHFLQLDFFEAA